MGASPLMSLGIRAMAANYASLQATGHNIANASVKGYSRQQAELATAQGQFTGAGFFGKGVDVVTVTRLHNQFLTRESDAAASVSAMDAARLSQLRRLENIFQPGDTGLGAAADELFAALSDMGSHPADLATRRVVLARAADLASRFAAAGSALDDVQAGVNAELNSSVSQINALAAGIAEANQRIAALRGLGQPANDLLDERERLIAQLSEQVQVTRVDAADGTAGIFIGGGQRLVLGIEAEELSIVRHPEDPMRSALALRAGGALRGVDPTTLGGGKVAGLLAFQNEDLAEGRMLVGELALNVATAVNAQQQRGLTLLGAAGTDVFTLQGAAALVHPGNQRDANGNPLGSVTFEFTAAASEHGADLSGGYTLVASTVTPGAWDLTRLSDGVVRTINSGDTVDGITITVTNPQVGDRFELQPALRAASGMGVALSDPRALAAASSLLASAAPANTGTLVPGTVQVTANPLPFGAVGETLTFTSAPLPPGSFSVTSSLGGALGNWQPGQVLVGANGFSFVPGGVPASGDSLVVAPTPGSALAMNNGNALALVALRDAALVGGRSFGDAWSSALAEVGARTQSAGTASTLSAAAAAQAEQARSSASGVNLDEEAARLIQFQQSYQAAAKVLQVAQALFDTLLDTAG